MVSNNILAFSVGLLGFSLCRGMCIKATIVAYAFLVQYFESATLVAYAGLRVKAILRSLLPQPGQENTLSFISNKGPTIVQTAFAM